MKIQVVLTNKGVIGQNFDSMQNQIRNEQTAKKQRWQAI